MEELRSRIAAMENGSAKAGSSGPPSRIWRRSPEPQQQQQQQRLPPVARSASNLQPRNQAPELQQPKTGDEAADERETVRQKLQEMEAKLTAAKVQRLQSEAGKRAIKPPAGSVALRASGSSAMLQAAAAKAREASAAAAETVGTTAENAGGAAPVMAAGTDEAGKPGAPKNQIPKAGSSPSLRQLTDSKQQDEAAQLKAKLQAMEAQIQIMNKKVAAGKAQRAASKPQGGGQKDVSQAQGGVQQSVSKSQAGGQQPVSKSQGSGQQAVSTPQLPRPSRQPPPAQQQADRQQQLPQGNPLQVIRHQALQQQVSNQADQFLEGLFVSDVSHSASHQQPWLMPSMALPSPMMNYFAMAGQPILPGEAASLTISVAYFTPSNALCRWLV